MRHIARWQAVKSILRLEEEDEEGITTIREKEQFSHCLNLLFMDVAAVWAAVHQHQSFRVDGPGLPSLESSLGEKAECHRGSLSIPGRRQPVRHLVAVSAELAQTRLGAAIESNRTILSDRDPVFVLYRLSERFGLPVVPEWADWFMSELKRRRTIRPLAGLGCSPVLITGTKARFLSWISRGLRRGEIRFPAVNGPIRWTPMAGFLEPKRAR